MGVIEQLLEKTSPPECVAAAVSGGLNPKLISFEVTETSAATNMVAATEFAARLERLGCGLALDDFEPSLAPSSTSDTCRCR